MASDASDIVSTVFQLLIAAVIFSTFFRRAKRQAQQRGAVPPPPGGTPATGNEPTIFSLWQNMVKQAQLQAKLGPTASQGPVPAMQLLAPPPTPRLQRRERYLQVALNSTLSEAQAIIQQLPFSSRILVEAGTPLIKAYGMEAITSIRRWSPAGTYIVADLKTADLANREVAMAAAAGANGVTCLGVAPLETINSFILSCEQSGVDSMVDMMNVERPQLILRQLKKLPRVVVVHRGVDETEFSKEKQIPFYQIQQIKGGFNMLLAVAGGDSIREVQRAIFNGADIVVAWKDFYQSSAETGNLAQAFLKEIK